MPLILQHPQKELQHLGNPSQLILMAEDRFKHPYCAFSPFLYPERCSHLKVSDQTKALYFLNKKEVSSVQVVRASVGEKFWLRMGNAGTEATWNFNVSAFKSAMLLSIDGIDVQRGHHLDTGKYVVTVTTGQRTDVMVEIEEPRCYPILVYSGSHAGDERQPHGTVLYLNASPIPQACRPVPVPKFAPAYIFTRLTPARYPLKKREVTRFIHWNTTIGDQFGGFPTNCPWADSDSSWQCREFKKLIPPYRAWKDPETGYIVHSRRPCQSCESTGRFNTSGIWKGRCWEWRDFRDAHTTNCSRFVPVDVSFDVPEKQRFLRPDSLKVCRGDRVSLTLTNTPLFDAGEGHPIHLHGHKSELRRVERLLQNGTWHTDFAAQASGAGAPHDTIWVPPNHSMTVEFDANNPGDWLVHCHNDFHLFNGMAVLVSYLPETDPSCHFAAPEWQPISPISMRRWGDHRS